MDGVAVAFRSGNSPDLLGGRSCGCAPLRFFWRTLRWMSEPCGSGPVDGEQRDGFWSKVSVRQF